MNIRQLLYFLTAAEESSFSGAAEKLHVSRQTLSRAIKQMEDEWGLALFKRNVAGVHLTNDGAFLYEQGNRLLESFEGLEVAMQARAEAARPGLEAFVISGMQTIFLKRIENYRKEHPGERLSITLAKEAECEEALFQGRAAVITTTGVVEAESIRSRKISEFPMYITVSPENPLSQRKELRVKDLEGQTLVTFPEDCHIVKEFMALCREKKVSFRKIEYNTDFLYCCELLCQNRGKPMALPAAGYAIHQQERLGLRCIPLAREELTWRLYASWNKRDEEKQMLRQFLDEVMDVCLPDAGKV